TAITNNTFLVLERDGKTPGQSSNIIKKLYKIDISNATNVFSSDENGKLFNGKTIEQLTTNEINSLIKCVSKEEVLDIMSIPNYPHDKPEGVVIINNKLIAIVNDDDFGILTEKGNVVPKSMPLNNNRQDENVVYFVKLNKPLY
ncbi:MAG: esterase-like activity of phytase family protein, partial [Candidatus Kapaibacteriota bacterium]